MRKFFRLLAAGASVLLAFAFPVRGSAQTVPQWSIAPVDGNGHSIRAGFDPTRNRHHVAALDANGNLFIAGRYYLNPGNPLPESMGQFLGKYDADSGAELWRFAGPVESFLSAVAVNGVGDAFVAGFYVAGDIEQHYVARISGATGSVMWEARGMPNDTSESYALDIVLDASGNPLVLGGSNGRRQAIVTKYDANTGAVQWSVAEAADAPATQLPFGLERAANGDIVGYTFYGDTPATEGSVLFKLDPATGARIWAVPLAYKPGEIVAFTLDPIGKPILAGKVVAKYSNVDGSLFWSTALDPSSTNSFAYDVAVRSNGDVYAAGTIGTHSSVPLLVLLHSADGSNGMYAPDADDQTIPDQYARSVTVDINGHAVVVERLFDTSLNDYVIATRVISPSDFPMHARYAPGSGASNGDADLALVRLTTPYVVGHFYRQADGATLTVALKYAAVGKVNSTMTLTASPNPAPLHQPVSMTATVSGPAGTPTGTVDFSDGASSIASCQGVALSDGVATCNAGTLTPGTHNLFASYSGDALYNGRGASTTETVQNNQATVSLASSANPAAFEQPVTFTVSVSGSAGTPSGTITFKDGASGIYGCIGLALSAGSATCTLNGLMPGTHSISASYSGDSSYDPATSSSLGEVVQGAIAAPALAWQATTTDSSKPIFDTTVNAVSLGPRGGVDSAGNLYVVATGLPSGNSCVTVIRYNAASGAADWRYDKCAAGTTFGSALGVDGSGNVLVTGTASDSLYVAKLSGATGAPIWEHTIASTRGMGLGLDAAGDARVVGWNGSAITIYGIANADGSVQWQTPINTVLGGKAISFAVDAAGSSAIYERHTIDSHDNVADVTTRLDPAGNVAWAVTEPGGESNLVMDAQGNVIGWSITGLEKRDVSTGAVIWRQSFGGIARPDAQGNVYVASNTQNLSGGSDALFAKIDPAGNVAWSHLFVDPNAGFLVADAALDTDGNLIAVASGGGRQLTYKVSSQDGHLIWLARLADLGFFEDPAGIFGVSRGVLTFGELIGSSPNTTNQGLYAALYTHDAASAASGALMLSPASLDFGGESMGTTSPARTITVSNMSSATVNVTGISVTGPFAQTHNCAALAPNAACVISVTFSPPVSPGELNSTASATGALTVTHDGAGSPATAALSGTAEKSLVAHYYRAILGRTPDAGGHDFWANEAARMAGLGANVNEAWFAMAMAFYASAEYAGRARDDGGYLTDLYATFFNRAPDSGGFAYWMGQMSSGMPRETVLLQFLFSQEFASFTQGIFGNTAARPEIDMTMDFYRGVLARLPDANGYTYYVGQFRAAQCSGADAVRQAADTTSQTFLYSTEYANRARTNAQYVSDLYNAILRRGGDRESLQNWIGQLDSGALTREQVRVQFIQSPEFSNRVSNVVNAGCMH